MKTNKLLLVGGDKRRDYIEKYLNGRGYTTCVYEKDPALFKEEILKKPSAVILPLPVSRDGKTVNIYGRENEPIYLDGLLQRLEAGDRVFGGMLSDGLKVKMSEKGIKAYDYYDEDIILKNAVITAECLADVLKENGVDILNAKIAVTGFGRTAKAISEMLYGMNCDFYIAARSDEALNDAKSRNYKCVKLKNFTEETPKTDVIINTVPALILDEKILYSLNSGAYIFDIASYPYGVDIELAKEYGINAVRALSLPGKYSPERAGIIIGEKVESLL